MNCAAIHRSMGLGSSFVRSLSMDTWSEKQLRLMALGGNKKLRDQFQNYDLNDETVQIRYNTKAADFYRKYLRGLSENIPMNEGPPDYEVGRAQIPAEEKDLIDMGGREAPRSDFNTAPEHDPFHMFGALGHVASSVKDLGSSAISGAS